MSWSLKLGRIGGIPIYVHWTFLILILWVIFGYWSESHRVDVTLVGVAFTLALFGCVVLHELGHALAAQRFGVPTADITLLPIGGIARMQRIPEKPAEELIIALAGPAVNVVIAAALYVGGVRLHANPADPHLLIHMQFLPKLMFVNAFLVAFNMLPAFPMDGGRVLRALLAFRLEYGRATRIAASIGQLMAIGFGFLGLMGNPMLLLIAMFVWIGAEGESAQVQERLMLRDIPVREAMLTDFETLAPSDTLARAAALLLAGSQADFPVVNEGRAVGVLTRDGLMSGLTQSGAETLLSDVPLAPVGSVEANSSLAPAVARLREGESPCLQVVDQGRPVGLLTLENVGEFLMLRTALAHPRAPEPAHATST